MVGEFASRITGSSDLYEPGGRRPYASINFVTAHDGFTLRDLVTYEKKRNEVNGEKNRDGWDDNRAWNCGVEGPTDDERINALRARQQRNLLVTLMLSQGVPMLCAGDEMGKTQGGNNNAFVQDNAISWLDWELDAERSRLLDFARELVAFRREHPVFRRPRFLKGKRIAGSELPDVAWFHRSGREMNQKDWQKPDRCVLGLLLAGDALDWRDAMGTPLIDDSFLLLLNGGRVDLTFVLPDEDWGSRWSTCIDTTKDSLMAAERIVDAGAKITLVANSVMVLKRVTPIRGSWRARRVSDRPPKP